MESHDEPIHGLDSSNLVVPQAFRHAGGQLTPNSCTVLMCWGESRPLFIKLLFEQLSVWPRVLSHVNVTSLLHPVGMLNPVMVPSDSKGPGPSLCLQQL